MEPLDGKYSEGLVGADEKARKRKLTQLERLDICTRSGVMFDTNVEEETFLEHEGYKKRNQEPNMCEDYELELLGDYQLHEDLHYAEGFWWACCENLGSSAEFSKHPHTKKEATHAALPPTKYQKMELAPRDFIHAVAQVVDMYGCSKPDTVLQVQLALKATEIIVVSDSSDTEPDEEVAEGSNNEKRFEQDGETWECRVCRKVCEENTYNNVCLSKNKMNLTRMVLPSTLCGNAAGGLSRAKGADKTATIYQ